MQNFHFSYFLLLTPNLIPPVSLRKSFLANKSAGAVLLPCCLHTARFELRFVGVVCRSLAQTREQLSPRAVQEEEAKFFQNHPAYKVLGARCGTRYLAKMLNQECPRTQPRGVAPLQDLSLFVRRLACPTTQQFVRLLPSQFSPSKRICSGFFSFCLRC